MKLLADYKSLEHDGFEFNECDYASATELIQEGILKNCGCGRPEENLSYILTGLELIAESGPDKSGPERERDAWWSDYEARRTAHFGNLNAAYFFYYWADREAYTEHGGGVPGWLTPEGEDLLNLLREWKAGNKE